MEVVTNRHKSQKARHLLSAWSPNLGKVFHQGTPLELVAPGLYIVTLSSPHAPQYSHKVGTLFAAG